MTADFGNLNWIAIALCVVVGQVFLTLWFTLLFGAPWARVYGVATRAEHAQAIPPYTYGIGLACTFLVTLGLALLQGAVGVVSVGAGLQLGALVAACFAIPAIVPGYAFLGKLDGALIAAGSQGALVMLVSGILAAWR